MLEDAVQEPKKRFKKRYFVLLPLVVLVFMYKDFIFPSTWNYKVTVEIETPNGTGASYAVRQIKARFSPAVLPEMADVEYEVIGEAVVLELGEQTVAYLIMSGTPIFEFFKAFPVSGDIKSNRQKMKYYRSLSVGTEGRINSAPHKLVYFKDTEDPTSLDVFDSDQIKVKSITYQITNEPVTKNIYKYLDDGSAYGPNIFGSGYREFIQWLKTLTYGDNKRVGLNQFSRGELK